MPTIQEQIDTLEQTILDLESSASGISSYLTQYTLDAYDTSSNGVITYYDDLADGLDVDIVSASGSVRILRIGISML